MVVCRSAVGELKPKELDRSSGARDFSTLSLTELSFTICELLELRRPNGGLKSPECYDFLQALQQRGWLPWLSLQPRKLRPRSDSRMHSNALKRRSRLNRRLPSRSTAVARQQRRPPSVCGSIFSAPYLVTKCLTAQLRYFVRSPQPPRPLLACLLFTSAAWKMARHGKHIGWSQAARRANLPLVVNHSRFLILPWIRVPNLASHILSRAARQLPRDWFSAYGAQPVLLETLVDGTRYHGGCYRAANWTEVGLTQGRGRMDRSGKAQGVRKHIFLFPLHRHWRARLCDPPDLL